MKSETIYQNGFYLLVGLIIGFTIASFTTPTPASSREVAPVTGRIDTVATPETARKEIGRENVPVVLNEENLMAELERQDMRFPEIVLAQAKLETGNFTSGVCKAHNNLFGLRKGKGYHKFFRWEESVTAYKTMIQSRYDGGDYYAFLERIGYAEEPKYTRYLKSMVNQNRDNG